MMQIPVFAKELGLHSITYQKLRLERFSPLKELVESTPGYYVGDDSIVYQDGLGRPYLKRISRRITRSFYTPTQFLKLASKLFRTGFFKRQSFVPLLLSVPVVLARMVARKVDKQMRRLSLWRNLFSA